MTKTFERHVVLIAPRIHWNTGNIGRTCLGTGTRLHLIRPLGFSLDSQHVRRAGLDYWPQVDVKVWEDFDTFSRRYAVGEGEIALFSKTGGRDFWRMPLSRRMFLVFGSETAGLPGDIRARHAQRIFHIPINDRIRSLNLSTAVALALYESLDRRAEFHGWPAHPTRG